VQIRESLAPVGLAALLVTCAFGQTPAGVLRVSVKVPGTLAPVPGVPISLVGPQGPQGPPSELLDLPDNEKDLLAYLEKLAAARGIFTTGASIVTTAAPYQSGVSMTCYPTVASPLKIDAPKAVTDASGNATIQGLKPGTYSLRAGLDGFLGDLPSEPGTAVAPNFVSSTLTVESGTSASQVSVYLTPAATVSGRIVDANGAPVVQACVVLEMMRSAKTGSVFIPGPRASTDNNGEYRLQSVSPGDYTVRVQLAPAPSILTYFPGVTDREKATLVSIPAGVDAVNIDFKLP
jgi:hypothetical protein